MCKIIQENQKIILIFTKLIRVIIIDNELYLSQL